MTHNIKLNESHLCFMSIRCTAIFVYDPIEIKISCLSSYTVLNVLLPINSLRPVKPVRLYLSKRRGGANKHFQLKRSKLTRFFKAFQWKLTACRSIPARIEYKTIAIVFIVDPFEVEPRARGARKATT